MKTGLTLQQAMDAKFAATARIKMAVDAAMEEYEQATGAELKAVAVDIIDNRKERRSTNASGGIDIHVTTSPEAAVSISTTLGYLA